MKLTRVFLSLISAIAVVAGALLFSAPAEAASYNSVISSPSGIAKMRMCPSVAARCDYGYYARNGARVNMVCYQDGEWATGAYRSNRWFKVAVQGSTGRTYWVHSSLVQNQTRVGRC